MALIHTTSGGLLLLALWTALVGCSVNPLDPAKKGCIRTAIADTCGGGNGVEPAVCGTSCGNIERCVGLQQYGLSSAAACVAACDAATLPIDGQTIDCTANAGSGGNCAEVVGCLDACSGTCMWLDACTAGGLAGQGYTTEQCVVGCRAGQLGPDSQISCVAGASSCDEVETCVK